MADIEQQLSSIEEQLKKLAEELGQLNLSNNRYQESNEQLSSDIIAITNKINKKKHQIEQENKDKQIIHQKLVRAEKTKEELEIKQSQQKAQKEKERKMREQQERQKQHEEKIKQQQRANEAERAKRELIDKHSPIKIQQNAATSNLEKKVASEKARHEQPVRQEKPTPKEQTEPTKVQTKLQVPQIPSSLYDNSEKGEYQPPALFLDDENSDDDEQEQDNSKVLQNLRSKLRLEKELHENDDDDQ